MRDTYTIVDVGFPNLPGWPTGPPTRGILHTDGNPNAHTALGAMGWGDRVRAFSIPWYIEGKIAYRGVPEDWHASHVREPRVAAQKGWPTTWPGLSKPRGDIRALGFEHVMEPDGTWDQETRLTSVLLGADVSDRWPRLHWDEHAAYDPWTRPNDVGRALWVPDWRADVADVLAGREPYRVVGVDDPRFTGSATEPVRPSIDPTPDPRPLSPDEFVGVPLNEWERLGVVIGESAAGIQAAAEIYDGRDANR